MKMDYDLGLSRIYELVINSNPCYAFLLDSNSLVQNKLVSAHVLAHCDFFKNNMMFHRTSRNVVESMAASAERFRTYELQYGKDEVEAFLDAALALQEHIDPSERAFRHPHTKPDLREEQEQSPRVGKYDDLFALDGRLSDRAKVDEKKAENRKAKGFAKDAPQKDLLLFLQSHSKILAEWQRDMLTVIREEMLYFWPQIETKIMNEGWASDCKNGFFHSVRKIQMTRVIPKDSRIPNKEATQEPPCLRKLQGSFYSATSVRTKNAGGSLPKSRR
ncbi:hypothetical protein AYW79_08550 [Ferroacidibacillus organovorans]|uniref:SpoVR protein-like N-terminal domain-containing protein n=1 Tax=Ferroacidibacillus organovorans TaxID=1765683 RepID=A0A853KEM0_9BACL|nr:hypothetical protein AYJ22_08400 [Ferroacidibacillus organovorans]OAG93830.1 hypothetical protein AYW79_08550 [Ferroacidibacillus organovorans]